MKILICTNHSYMLWQFRRELISQLMREHEVVLGMPFVGHEEDFQAMGLECVDTPMDRRGLSPFKDLALLGSYRRLLRDARPDLVLTYSVKPNIYCGWLCLRMGIPYYPNVQGLGSSFQDKRVARVITVMYRHALRDARGVFFENSADADQFVRDRVVPRAKTVVLPGAGVNLDAYPLTPYPSEEGGVRFLFLGRIMREKGVREFFTAARRLKARYGERAQVELVGFFEEDFHDTVRALEAEGVLRYRGFQSNVIPFYAAAHCVVIPSYREGMCNVLLEASSMGRAIITTDEPGCREAVDGNGFLCPRQDAGALYECMERFMELDSAERERMGRLGRERMERLFDKREVVGRVVETLLA